MIIEIVSSLIIGGTLSGVFVHQKLTKEKAEIQSQKNKDLDDQKDALEKAKKRLDEERSDVEQRRIKVEKIEEKIIEKEDKIDTKLDELEKKGVEITKKTEDLERQREDVTKIRNELRTKLSDIAGLTKEEARDLIMKQTEELYEKDVISAIEKKKSEMRLKEREVAREIIIKSIQQYAGEVVSETTQTTLHLDNDDIKGKLIGKEGRNIITFERETGVSLIIDDTPDTVFISSFDLFRRFIAKKSLEQLIEDKRIQPARIEEIVAINKADAEKLIFEFGEKTVNEMGIAGLPNEILSLVGKLRFRTSFGQNILTHSKEVAYISEAIAKELGADPALALKGGLLHDIGKAMDHDIEGTHPEIGAKIARKYGLNESIVNIIECHHSGPSAYTCIETHIVQIADAISAVRPGARRASVEQYIKRIQEMENLVAGFKGVTRAYALSAGREVRVFVDCESIGDLDAEKMAREIALSIENNLNYPGEIKVTLIREKRITEYAR